MRFEPQRDDTALLEAIALLGENSGPCGGGGAKIGRNQPKEGIQARVRARGPLASAPNRRPHAGESGKLATQATAQTRGAPRRRQRHRLPAPQPPQSHLGYGSTTAAKEVAPQSTAQSPSDRSEIRIKDVLVSGQLWALRFSNVSAGSPQAPRDRNLLSTSSPPSGVHQAR